MMREIACYQAMLRVTVMCMMPRLTVGLDKSGFSQALALPLSSACGDIHDACSAYASTRVIGHVRGLSQVYACGEIEEDNEGRGR